MDSIETKNASTTVCVKSMAIGSMIWKWSFPQKDCDDIREWVKSGRIVRGEGLQIDPFRAANLGMFKSK